MGPLASYCRKRNMTNPTVAMIGSSGYMGKHVMPSFLEAANLKILKELRVLTTQKKLDNEVIKSYGASGAKVVAVDFSNISSVSTALAGVDVVVSTLGTDDGIEEVKKTLLSAMVQAKVKIYFPSEFGTNHYRKEVLSYNHPLFVGKREHFAEAKRLKLNPIRMLCGNVMEYAFGLWFGFDFESGVWTLVGKAADLPCAMTSERDVGRFTLEAVLLACKSIKKCPDELEVYSDMKTLREYAKAFEKESGNHIKIETVQMEKFRKLYEESENQFVGLIRIMFAEGAYDYTMSNGNHLLNPNESKWKLKKIEEYAVETKGAPWQN